METLQKPELAERAGRIVPLLRGNAYWSEGHRRLHPLSIEAMADAGVFKLRVPERYGGFACDSRTLTKVLGVLGQGDGSAAWTTAVWSIAAWMTCLFPDEVQDEVFATPDVRICATLSPTAVATPKDSGYSITGQWAFMSGALHSQWQVAVAATENAGPILALVPMAELGVMDDWYTTGLKGSGSVTTIATGVYVPATRVLSLGAVLNEQYASVLNADNPVYRSPLLPTASASSVGTLLGLARGAMGAFLHRLPNRGITYTGYTSQREAPVTHLQVAAAAMKIDEAEFHAERLATQVDAKAMAKAEWTTEERARARADMGAVCQLVKEAVDILNTASGGTSIYDTVPIQQIERDVLAINLHALMHPNTNLELYGRVLCGLDPNTYYL
ncbi:acyl-CoA dehydrogenase [Acrocarpospora phusangensis]|uniref:Acyl-CoA dehydrogenase n=1 Tax=Acrocarpospora phusangensis TaxID=1070424 RepID=A0A919QBJ7_9ACTN|nr:acyl-CoA dehydrogenase family protein [Acrocarpospora phusangensis]GIH24373.1 acyl-CoA dehydrogenase [Acrocarpospora phusangensis]